MSGETGNTAKAQEVVLTKILDAPRELVYEMWTVAEHFSRWFGPHDVEMLDCRIDPHSGGVIQFCHQRRDGTQVRAKGEFREVIPPGQLAFETAFVDEEGRPAGLPILPDYPVDIVMTTNVMLEEIPEGTRMTVRQTIKPVEAAQLESVIQERKLARLGWGETLERLAELLSSME